MENVLFTSDFFPDIIEKSGQEDLKEGQIK